ncbi:MAG: hypothetical protein ABL918_09335 [Chakrabartia sp.]
MLKFDLVLAALAIIARTAASANEQPRFATKLHLVHADTKGHEKVEWRGVEAIPLKLATVSTRPASPFDLRLMTISNQKERSTSTLEWANGALSFSALTKRSPRRTTTVMAFNYNRFALMMGNLDITQSIGAQDNLAIGMTFALERRRPALVVAAHNYYRTLDRSATLSWNQDDIVKLSGSLFHTGPNWGRSQVERLVERAGGAPSQTRGYALSSQISPSGNADAFAFGIDLRSQRDFDVCRHDSRAALFLRKVF